MSTALATTSRLEIMPVYELEQMKARRTALVQFVKDMMVAGTDYGAPGQRPAAGDKPDRSKNTLLKPGAEKLNTFFGLVPHYDPMREVEDWDNGLFFYRYRCILTRNGEAVGEGIGSCNSREVKYRWRVTKKICPTCGQPTIRRAGKDWGAKVWYCHVKSGGCGASFERDRDETEIAQIEAQAEGREVNKEPFDLVNTIDKIAQKRALVAAVLVAVNASEFFTQDLEDFEQPDGAQLKPAGGAQGEGGDADAQASAKTRGNGAKPVASREVKQGPAKPANGNGDAPSTCGGEVGEGQRDLRINNVFMAELVRIAGERGIAEPIVRGILADTAKGHGKPSLTACDNYWRNSLIDAITAGTFDHLKGAVVKGNELPTSPPASQISPSAAGATLNPTAPAAGGRATVERLAELMEMLQAITLPEGAKERWFATYRVREWGELPAVAVELLIKEIGAQFPGVSPDIAVVAQGIAGDAEPSASHSPTPAPSVSAPVGLAECMPDDDEVGPTGSQAGWDKFRALWDDTAIANKWAPEYANTMLAKRLGRVGKTGLELDTTLMWRKETIAAARANRINPKDGSIIRGDEAPNDKPPTPARRARRTS